MTKDDLKITTYKDGKDYVFISYASKDEGIVFNKYVIPLQERYGLNIFCDLDFKNHAHENWSDQMTENIMDAKLCILFTSKDYVCSYACFLEVLTALVNDVPILKLQINSPEVSSDLTEKTISPATKSHFLEIGEILNHAQKGDSLFNYFTYYSRISQYVNKGYITPKRLSKQFHDCLGSVASTTININSGFDSIVSSINNAVGKNAQIYGSFPASATDKKPKDIAASDITADPISTAADAPSETTPPMPADTAGSKPSVSSTENTYTFCGNTVSGSQSRMMTAVIKFIVEKHFDMFDTLSEQLTCLKPGTLRSQTAAYFHSGKEYTYQGQVYSVGTAYDLGKKLAQIRKAIILTGEDPHDYQIDGLFNEKQLKEAEERYAEMKAAGDPDIKAETNMEAVEIICCFLSKFNNEAAMKLGCSSISNAFAMLSERYGVKESYIRNLRDSFDPFFPESGRKGWWQNMDRFGASRQQLIDRFKAFKNVDDAFSFVKNAVGL